MCGRRRHKHTTSNRLHNRLGNDKSQFARVLCMRLCPLRILWSLHSRRRPLRDCHVRAADLLLIVETRGYRWRRRVRRHEGELVEGTVFVITQFYAQRKETRCLDELATTISVSVFIAYNILSHVPSEPSR